MKLAYHFSINNQEVHSQREKHVDYFGYLNVNWCPRTCDTVSGQGKILDVEFRSQSQLTTSDSLDLTYANTDKLGSSFSRHGKIRVCVIRSWRQLIAGVNPIPF